MNRIRLKLGLALLGAGAAAAIHAATPTDAAVKLYQRGDFSAARAALEKIVAADPADAPACYYLGMALRHRGDDRAFDDAVVWLGKAVALAPGNAAYVADYGGTCLQLADRRQSFSLAVEGRDAMIRGIALDPGNLDAREGLMRFYAQAPWPLGSAAQAAAQAGEIRRRDPARGLRAFLRLGKIFEKNGDSAAARDAYAEALKLAPGNPAAKAALARLHP